MDRARRKLVSAIDGIRNLHVASSTTQDEGDYGDETEEAEEALASGEGLDSQQPQQEIEIDERITAEHCCLTKLVRHGLPHEARCIAYDPVQRLLALGASHGRVQLLGQLGVDYHLEHTGTDACVEFMQFLVNEGGLVTSLQDDSIHLWNYRQKVPEIVHSLKMAKEGITALHLPFQSKWLYVGTDRGNVYFVQLATFQLSAYVINWNKAVDIACRTHPGAIRQLALSPTDTSRLLLLFEKGHVVGWNLQTREADRFAIDHSPAKCLAWHHDGRQFMCGHKDGSLTIWNTRKPKEVVQKSTPHSASDTRACRPITHLWWAAASEHDQMVCFAGGMPAEEGALPALTVLRGKAPAAITVLEMEHPVVEVLPLYALPFPHLAQLPPNMALLLREDLLVVDMQSTSTSSSVQQQQQQQPTSTTDSSSAASGQPVSSGGIGASSGYPVYDSPHPMDVGESTVTALSYYADCPVDLIAALILVGRSQRQKVQQQQQSSGGGVRFSEKPWPISGGVGRECATGHEELLLTGHADGSIKFWQATGEHLQLMYRLKTGRHFEKTQHHSSSHKHPAATGSHKSLDLNVHYSSAHSSTARANGPVSHAVEVMEMCLESRLLLVASAAAAITLFRFVKNESSQEIAVVVLAQLAPVSVAAQLSGNATEDSETTSHSAHHHHRQQHRLKPHRASSSPSPSRELRRQAHATMAQPSLLDPQPSSQTTTISTGSSTVTQPSSDATSIGSQLDAFLPLKVRGGVMRRPAGYQPELVCQIPWGEHQQYQQHQQQQGPERITAMSLNSAYGVFAVGTATGIALVDFVTSTLVYAWTTQELHRRGVGGGKAGIPPKAVAGPRSPNPATREKGWFLGGGGQTEDKHAAQSGLSQSPTSMSPSSTSPATPQPQHSPSQRVQADVITTPTASSSGATIESNSKNGVTEPGEETEGKSSSECNGEVTIACQPSLSSTTCGERVVVERGTVEGALLSPACSGDEFVTSFQFLQSYSCKLGSGGAAAEPLLSNTLWVGLSTGWCIALNLHMPPLEERLNMLAGVVVAPSGSLLRLQGQLLHTAFMDQSLCLLRGAAEYYRDPNTVTTPGAATANHVEQTSDAPEGEKPSELKVNASDAPSSSSSSTPEVLANRRVTRPSMAPRGQGLGPPGLLQLTVLVAEQEIRVVGLPAYRLLQMRRLEIPLVKAKSSHVRGLPCLLTLNGMGAVQVYSLPSLRLLHQEQLFPFSLDVDDPVVEKFAFSDHGLAVFLASPTEVQKITTDSETAAQVAECSGELFVPCDMPEVPKASFLRGLGTSLFGTTNSAGGVSPRELVDLDAIFNEKPPGSTGACSTTKSVARQLPSSSGAASLLHHPHSGSTLTNMEATSAKGISAGQAVQQAMQSLSERQERLGAAVDATEQLRNNAASLQARSAKLVEKYEKKRWWNLR